MNSGLLYLSIFLAVNFILIVLFPPSYREKLFVIPKFHSKSEFVFTGLYAFLFNGTLLYSACIPLSSNVLFISIGSTIYILALILFIIALSNYAYAPQGKPVTTGVYKYSRNPQQILASVLWFGVGISLGSYVVVISVILQLIILYPSLIAQERFCLEMYGEEYRQYMKNTARYLGKRQRDANECF